MNRSLEDRIDFISYYMDELNLFKSNLKGKDITLTKEVLLGQFIKYATNLADNMEDQKRFLGGLNRKKKKTDFDVTNVELIQRRCAQIAAMCLLIYEKYEDYYGEEG